MSAARFVAWLPPWLPDALTRPSRVSCKGGAVGRRRAPAEAPHGERSRFARLRAASGGKMAVHAARVRDGVRFGRRPHAARRGSVAAPGRVSGVMRRLAASIVLTFSLSFGSTGRAAEEPKVTLEATLDSSSRVVAPALPVP